MRGATSVRIAQPESGALKKRQATLQICFRPKGEQPKIAVIFRGKGNVKASEKQQWDKRVDVYFQENAWLDEETACEWVSRTLSSAVRNLHQEFILLCDNVNAQISNSFKGKVGKMNGKVVHFPANCSDLIQPVDAGLGRELKRRIAIIQDAWLQSDNNFEKWEGKMTASQRRIILSKWIADAWEYVTKRMEGTLRSYFLKTGSLITANGDNDDEIHPEGFRCPSQNYKGAQKGNFAVSPLMMFP